MDVLKDILNNLNDSIIILDKYGQVVLFNNEAVRIQMSVSEKPLAIGSHYAELIGEEHRKGATEILRMLKRQKRAIRNFAEHKTPTGGTVFLEVSYVPVLGSRKEIRYINVITQDVTSRKIFEKRIRATSADVSKLLDDAHAVIFSVDTSGYIVDWNNYCARMTGYPKEEILCKKFCDTVIAPYHVHLFEDMMANVLQNKSVGNYEFPLRTRDGHEVIVMLSATPRTNVNGEVIGATLVGQDITELTSYRLSLEKVVQNKTAALKKVLRKEKEAVELRNRFVSIASHEFRTPLSSIDFAANFIRKNAGSIGKRKLNEKVAVIERQVNHMSHLLEDVLNFGKNEQGRIKVVPAVIRLDEFVRNVVEEVTCGVRHSHHICVSTNRLGSLLTDEKLLRNILVNLLTNAVKFSPAADEVSLNVLDHDTHITLEVRDEGIGIPEEEMEIIFEPFTRGKAVDSIQGTGLGLCIVKKAVDLLNGTIEVKSQPGKGSTFLVTIPRQAAFV